MINSLFMRNATRINLLLSVIAIMYSVDVAAFFVSVKLLAASVFSRE
jgi:hypothetical protein